MKIDVHVVAKPRSEYTVVQQRWYDQCIASLEGEPINLHIVPFVQDDSRAARRRGFNEGTSPYVSFIDADDWVEPGVFQKCLDAITTAPEVCGVFTLSNKISVNRAGVETNMGLMHPYQPWPLTRIHGCTNIHQLTVMRREDVLSTYNTVYDKIPALLPEVWMYWHMARTKPWLPLNFVGHNWRASQTGTHRVIPRTAINECSMLIKEVQRSALTNKYNNKEN